MFKSMYVGCFTLIAVLLLGCASQAQPSGAGDQPSSQAAVAEDQTPPADAGPKPAPAPIPIVEKQDPPLTEEDTTDDRNGGLAFENTGRQHFLIYLDGKYAKSVRANQSRVLLDPSSKNLGNIFGRRILIAYYYFDEAVKLGFTDINNPPKEALCRSTNIVLSSSSTRRTFSLNNLREEDIKEPNERVNSVMVRFRYPGEDPKLHTTVEVFQGNTDSRTVIASLEPNGEVVEAPLSPGRNQIRYNYSVGHANFREDRYYVFPEGIEQNQHLSPQYNILITENDEGKEFEIPMFSKCGTISWKYDTDVVGKITIRNRSPFPQKISCYLRGGARSKDSIDRHSSVPSGAEWIEAGTERSYPLNSGIWDFWSEPEPYTIFAKLETVHIEKGYDYFWYIMEDESTFEVKEPNPPTARYIANLLQNWTLRSNVDGVDFKVNIENSENPSLNNEVALGTSNGKQLRYEHSIPNLIRGITAKNARSYTLRITASKEGYGPASQAINAYTLIGFGKNFYPEEFKLVKAEPVDFVVQGPHIIEVGPGYTSR